MNASALSVGLEVRSPVPIYLRSWRLRAYELTKVPRGGRNHKIMMFTSAQPRIFARQCPPRRCPDESRPEYQRTMPTLSPRSSESAIENFSKSVGQQDEWPDCLRSILTRTPHESPGPRDTRDGYYALSPPHSTSLV